MTKILHFILIISLFYMASEAQAAHKINFQGRLTNPQGQPIQDGQVDVRFEVYDALEGGTKLWPIDPQVDGVESVDTNEAGLFSTEIGPFPDDFFSSAADYFIQVYVNRFGFQRLDPRRKLNRVPLSFHADKAGKADVALQATQATLAETVADNAINSDKIQDGSIDRVDIKDNAVGSNKITDGDIQNVDLADEAITAEKVNLTSLSQAALPWVPKDAIFMFLKSCPDGYDEVKELRNRVPIGTDIEFQSDDVADLPGNNVDVMHSHPHEHQTTIPDIRYPGTVEVAESLQDHAGFPDNKAKMVLRVAALAGNDHILLEGVDHNHAALANPVNSTSLPPAYTVIFLQKKISTHDQSYC